MKDEQAPRRLIAAALFSTESTAMLPNPYEQRVAQQYIAGSLSVQQAIALLEEHNRTRVDYSFGISSQVHAERGSQAGA